MKAAQYIKENPLQCRCHCGGSVWLCYERPIKGQCNPTIEIIKTPGQQLSLF